MAAVKTALVAVALVIAGCTDNNSSPMPQGDDAGQPAPVEEAEVAVEQPDATVGSQPEAPPAEVPQGAVFHDGAFGAPPAEVRAPGGATAQEVANKLYEYGIRWEDGTEHQPTWVACSGAPGSESGEGRYNELYCEIAVAAYPGYYQYYIRVYADDTEHFNIEWLGNIL